MITYKKYETEISYLGEENIFEEYKEVTKKKHVKTATNIIKNPNWKNTKVQMAHLSPTIPYIKSLVDTPRFLVQNK